MSEQRRAALALAMVFLAGVNFGCGNSTKDTRAQDESAIHSVDAATLKAAQAKNIEGVITNYADDASWLPPNGPIANGKAAIRKGWSQLIASPGFNIDWSISKLEVSRGGDLAYTIYAYTLTLQGSAGKPVTDHGKDLVTWKKQADGSWKMVAEAFNSDLPTVAPTKAPASKHRAAKHHSSKRRKRR